MYETQMKKKSLPLKLSIFILLISTQYSFCQSRLSDTLELEEVVVTGTLIKTHRNYIPLAVSVVTRNEIAESDQSALLPILSGRVPGLFVTERGVTGFGVADGSAGQITIRGIGGYPTTQVLVLIDGHPQFMGIMGHPLPDAYVASDVERVEVIRGPASMLYGTNAMGGVINIITRKQAENGIHGNARIMVGSFNTQKYMASAGYKSNKLSVFGSINQNTTNGHRDSSDFRITNGYLKAGYALTDHVKLTSDFSLASFEAGDPGPDTLLARAGSRINITRGYWALTLENQSENHSGALKVFYNFGEHSISDGFHSRDANYGINLYETFELSEQTRITLGGDMLNYGGIAENIRANGGEGLVFKDTTMYDAGIYGFFQQTIGRKLSVDAGMRYQNHEKYGGEWVPSCGFALKYIPSATWKVAVSKGFRSPTIRELFLWNYNADLKPERIINIETGFLNSFLNSRLNTELTFFYIRGDNLIVTVPLKGLQNAGKIRNRGIEFSADAGFSENLKFILSYSYIHMKEPIFATPEHQLFLSGRYAFRKFRVTPSLQIIRNLDSDPSPLVYLENYTLLGLKITFEAAKFAELYLSADNLLNRTYAVNRYYTMPGVTFFAGANVKF